MRQNCPKNLLISYYQKWHVNQWLGPQQELALEKAPLIGFGRYTISATTPFQPDDLADLPLDTPQVVKLRVPEYMEEYARRGWKMFPSIERVYVKECARRELGWQPQYDFRRIIDCLKVRDSLWSPLARVVGSNGYHDREFTDGRIQCCRSPI
jgi:hypothetical protein